MKSKKNNMLLFLSFFFCFTSNVSPVTYYSSRVDSNMVVKPLLALESTMYIILLTYG